MMTDNNFQWQQERLGRFTSSEFYKLYIGKAKGIFGEGAMTYIRQKAAEIMTMEVKDEVISKSIEWGYEHELEACNEFQKRMNLCGIYYGKQNPKFFGYKDDAGGSPDWESIGDFSEEFRIGADFKCPYNSSEHLINLSIIGDLHLSAERFNYWVQLQCNMKFRDWGHSYFVSYDPRFRDDKLKMKIIPVNRNEEFINTIDEVLGMAIEERDRIISIIQN